jgi:MFS family permease
MTPAPKATVVHAPFTDVFRLRTFWITMAVGIAVNLAWHLYRVWLPRHFVVDLKFDDAQLQYLLMGYFLTADLGSIVFGFFTKKLVTPARPVERARKVVVLTAALVCLMATPAVFQPARWLMVPLYFIVGAGIMGVFAMFYSFVQDIIPAHTSKCLGLIGASVWFITSKLHPMIGRFADNYNTPIGKFAPILIAAAACPLLAALFALTWPDRREPEPAFAPNPSPSPEMQPGIGSAKPANPPA